MDILFFLILLHDGTKATKRRPNPRGWTWGPEIDGSPDADRHLEGVCCTHAHPRADEAERLETDMTGQAGVPVLWAGDLHPGPGSGTKSRSICMTTTTT